MTVSCSPTLTFVSPSLIVLSSLAMCIVLSTSTADDEHTELLRFQLLSAEGTVVADLRAENADDKEGWLVALEKVVPLHAAAVDSNAHEVQSGSPALNEGINEAISNKGGGAEMGEKGNANAAREMI